MGKSKKFEGSYRMSKPLKVVFDDGSEHLFYCTKLGVNRHLLAHNELRVELSLVSIYSVGDEEELLNGLKEHVFPSKIV
jgi:hypothetical protein